MLGYLHMFYYFPFVSFDSVVNQEWLTPFRAATAEIVFWSAGVSGLIDSLKKTYFYFYFAI
jgi:hypothetical protein